MTGRRRRTALIASAVASAALAAGASPADAVDDPSAYTDPAPKPVQEQEAVEQVEQALVDRGVDAKVTPTEIRTGVVVEAPPVTTHPDAAGGRATVRSASGVALSGAGLEPSVRAGVASPASAVVPDGALVALLAVLAAAVAGTVALRRG